MEGVIVCKFGGSSITSQEDVERIREITTDSSMRKIVVVSAPGKRNKQDQKVTDMLIAIASAKDNLAGRAAEITERYAVLAPLLDTRHEVRLILEQRLMNEKLLSYLDGVKAFGEEACAKVVAKALRAEYIDPKELFVVSRDFGNARILPASEKMIKERLGGLERLCIVPGFYGYTENGEIATFSRGGSDLTGAYIAATLRAIVYENYSDVPGILAADPKIVNNPAKIPELTFKEMRDLAYLGSKLHPEAIAPCAKKGIPIHIRETTGYPAEGTYVVQERLSDPTRPIVGVAYQGGFCSFDILRFGMNEEIGILRKILQVFEDDNIAVEYMPSAVDDVSVVLREDQLRKKDLGKIIQKIESIMGNGTSVTLKEHLGCLVVAGKGLQGHKGISASIQSTLAEAGVNLNFISQGSEERCIIYGINSADGNQAVNAIYEKYIR